MVSLMQRRREMLQNGIILPEWDVEWDYTMGLPENNGWDYSESGGGESHSMVSTGVRVSKAGTTGGVYYKQISDAVIGVFETKVAITTTNGYMVIRFGNGVNEISVRMQYSTNYKGIYLRDNSSIGSMSRLRTISLDTFYTVKLILYSSTADVFIDGIKYVDQVSISGIFGNGQNKGNSFGANTASNTTAIIQTMKMKLGRTS